MMKIQIRSGVFETNSSSQHSLVISKVREEPTKKQLNGYFGEYGWGYEELTTQEEKLSYILTRMAMSIVEDNSDIRELDKLLKSPIFKKFDELVQIMTGFGINMDECLLSNRYYGGRFGYIDHQSVDVLDEYTLEELVDIIFSESKIIIDNDNH